MQIDRDVKPLAPQLARKREIATKTGESASLRRHDDMRNVGIAAYDRGGRRFNNVSQLCAGIGPPQRPQERRRQHNIADQPQPDYKYLPGGWLVVCGW
jgi:hypothetical protein